jgi:hemin uptake protein HemP
MERERVNLPNLQLSEGSFRAPKKPRIESERLFQGSYEIVIVHQDEEYSLRITRNGKLILTK